MKKYIHSSILCGVLLVAAQGLSWAADQETLETKKPLARREGMMVTIVARIESIDYTNREVTLKGPLGNEETFIVDKRVKRFNEFKVGDHVQAEYLVSIAAELRKPTPEEEKQPLVILDAAGKATSASAPAAVGARRIKAVTTVEGLDRPTQTVTLKGPLGHYHTVRVENPENLTKMKIGDTVVVTYTEALALSLEKAPKKASE